MPQKKVEHIDPRLRYHIIDQAATDRYPERVTVSICGARFDQPVGKGKPLSRAGEEEYLHLCPRCLDISTKPRQSRYRGMSAPFNDAPMFSEPQRVKYETKETN